MKLLNVNTGKLEVVQDAQSAILNGTHAPKKFEKFTYVDPTDGGIFETTGDKLKERLESGARLESPTEKFNRLEEAEFGNRPIEAAIESGANALTFGLSSYINDKLLPETTERAAAVQRLNPEAAAVGEIAGVVIPALFSGGTSALGKAATSAGTAQTAVAKGSKAIAEQIVSNKLGQKVLGNVIEGAAYGAGKSLSESSLGNPSDLAENLLIGGGVGGGLTLASAATKALLNTANTGGRKLAGGIINLTSAQKQDATKFLGNSEEGRALRDLVLKGKAGVKELEENAIQIAKQNDELAKESANLFKSTKRAKASELLSGVEFLPAKAVADGVQNEGLVLLQKMQNNPEIYSGPAVAKLERELNFLGKGLASAKSPSQVFEALDNAKNAVDDIYRGARASTSAEAEAYNAVRDFNGKFRTSLEDDSVWKAAGTMQQKLNSAYAEFGKARGAFQKTFGKKVGDTVEINPRKIASLLKQSDDPAAQLDLRIYQDYIESSNKLRSSLAEYGAPTLEGKAAQEALMARRERLMQSSNSMQEFAGLKGGLRVPVFAGWLPVMVGPSAKTTISGLAWAEKQAMKVNKDWLKRMGEVAASFSRVAPLSIKNNFVDAKAVKQDMDDVMQMSQNPRATISSVSEGLNGVRSWAPNTANALEKRTADTVAFLSSKLPKQPVQGLLGLDEEWKPTPRELSRFSRYVQAAKNPMVLLDEVENGAVMPETVETVKTLYPQFFQKTVGGLTQYIAEKGVKIPRVKRAGLSILLNTPLNVSSQGAAIMALQQNFAGQEQQPKPTGNVPNIGPAFATQGQKLMGR